ncbi:MAG: hypothetical protein ACKO6N_09945 [Myxococcota bacterium]
MSQPMPDVEPSRADVSAPTAPPTEPPLAPAAAAFWGVLGVTALVYAPTLWNGLVWDDHALLTGDPRVTGPLSLSALFQPYWSGLVEPASGVVAYARPLVTLSFALQHALTGLLPWPLHGVNVLLHLLNGVLLERWLRPKLGAQGAALAVAFWLLHPTAVEAVAWISGRTDLLALHLGLLALLAWERARAGAGWTYDLFAGVALVGAGASKEVAFLFWPLLALSLIPTSAAARWRGASLLLLSGGLSLWARVESLRAVAVEPPALTVLEPLWLPLVRAVVSAGQLMSLWVWPFNPSALVATKTLPPPTSPLVWGGMLSLCLVGGGLLRSLWRLWRLRADLRGGHLLVLMEAQGWLMLSLGWLPVLNLVPLSAPSPVAERFWYVPSVGMVLLFCWALRSLDVRSLEVRSLEVRSSWFSLPGAGERVRRWGLGALSLWLLVSAAVVVIRGREWESDHALWRAELARHGVRHILGARNMGLALEQAGDLVGALQVWAEGWNLGLGRGTVYRGEVAELLLEGLMQQGQRETARALLSAAQGEASQSEGEVWRRLQRRVAP